MREYYFVAGRIRVLESRLLNVNRLDRMIGAKTPEEAFRVMVELQYSEYFDDSTRAEDFVQIIDQGLLETRNMLMESTQDAEELNMLWLRSDFNNIKRALKARLVEGFEGIDTFTEEAGYSMLGNISSEDITTLVWGEKDLKNLSPFEQVVLDAENVFETTKNFQQVEFFIDKQLMEHSLVLAKKTGSSFLKRLVAFQADSANLRTVIRSVLITKKQMDPITFVPGGNLDVEKITELSSVEEIKEFFAYTPFAKVLKDLSEETVSVQIMAVERKLERMYQDFLNEEEQSEIASVQIPFAYFERRMQNARLLKFIMYGKFHGVPAEKIYETVKYY